MTTTATSTSNGNTSRTAHTPAEGLPSQLAYLTRVLKTPTIGRCWEQIADQARDENWSHEEYLAAVLQRQVADRESAGNIMRIRTAHFPAVKTLEDFNLDHLPSLRRDVLAHLATGTFVAKAENVILLGPPGLGKTHLAIGLGVKAAQSGYSVLFDTANNWITRLATAHQAGRLEAELKKIGRYRLIIVALCRHRHYAEMISLVVAVVSVSVSRRGIVTGSQEMRDLVGRVVAAWSRRRGCGEGEGFLFDADVGVDVGVGGSDTGAAEPESDH